MWYWDRIALHAGSLEGALVSDGGSVLYGNYVEIYILVDQDLIKKISYKSFCGIQMLMDLEKLCLLVEGKSVKKCSRIGMESVKDDILLKTFHRALDKSSYSPLGMVEMEYEADPNAWEGCDDEQRKLLAIKVIDRYIDPYVELDAGSVEVVQVEGNRLFIEYGGNCSSCYASTTTTLNGITSILRKKLHPDISVIPMESIL